MLRLAVLSATCAAVLGVAGAAGAASSGPVLPSSDPFYSYSAASLTSVAPGTVLKHRTVTASGTGMSVTQLLYRTTGELGEPTATVTTIFRAAPTAALTKIVSYQMAYDSLGPSCDPSYTIQGGNPSGASTNNAEQKVLMAYVAAGDTVVVPDYEGTHYDWAAGQEEGYNTLDGIRAAENYLKLAPASTPVGMVGYSGGSIAAEFASELAPTYAPKLDLVGVAEGGVPVDFAHNLTYINGSPGWSGIIPAVLLALGRAFHISFADYSSAYGLTLDRKVQNECINSFFGAYPGLTVQKLLKPRWQDLYAIPRVAAITDKLLMGDTGTPKGPLFMGVGNADGTGDGVMVAKDVEALAHEYCQRGVSVQFTVYKGDEHTAAAVPFEGGALNFLTERLNGLPVTNGCSSISAGNSLAPVRLPPALKLTFGGLKPRLGGALIYMRTASAGTLPNLTVTLRRGRRLIETLKVAQVSTKRLKLVLRHNGHMLNAGRYTVTVTQPGTVLAKRSFRVR